MKDEKLSWKALLGGISAIIFISVCYLSATRILYLTINDLYLNASIVKINVYALWVPVGFFGALLFIISALFVAFKTRKKADQVWGEKGQKLGVRVTGIFAVLGLVFAISMYQWLTSELDERGYIYSKQESSLSAMGKHEVYIKKAD